MAEVLFLCGKLNNFNKKKQKTQLRAGESSSRGEGGKKVNFFKDQISQCRGPL